MPLPLAHAGDFHMEEDLCFTDTTQCLEWFVADAIQASVDLFAVNGDLPHVHDRNHASHHKRRAWVDRLGYDKPVQ